MKYLILIISISILFTFSCSSNVKNSEFQSLKSILADSLKIERNYSKLLILEDYGCKTCCKKFAEFSKNNLNDSTLLILSAKGARFSTEEFKKSNKDNIVIDYYNYIRKDGILIGSGFIKINKKSIDTVISIINPEKLNEKLVYIKSQL